MVQGHGDRGVFIGGVFIEGYLFLSVFIRTYPYLGRVGQGSKNDKAATIDTCAVLCARRDSATTVIGQHDLHS